MVKGITLEELYQKHPEWRNLPIMLLSQTGALYPLSDSAATTHFIFFDSNDCVGCDEGIQNASCSWWRKNPPQGDSKYPIDGCPKMSKVLAIG